MLRRTVLDNAWTIRPATALDADAVGTLVWQLLCELYPELVDQFARATFVSTARTLIAEGVHYWSFVVEHANQTGPPIALINLNECCAIYAGGRFGEVTEFYISPGHRSKGLGTQLLEAAKSFGLDRGWRVLEVGAPNMMQWSRSVAFYQRNGFSVIGLRLEIAL
jgi:GNAT superfamily N-acetyltransferase